MPLSPEQYEQLLRPINPSRVLHRQGGGKQLSYVNQSDVRNMLIRIFGFGGWDGETFDANLVFESFDDEKKQWSIGWKVRYQLTIRDELGYQLARYSEAAVGFATLGSRGEAHDMAIKAAESDAMKRCCVCLGDQFGGSLYFDGSTKATVGRTLVGPGPKAVDVLIQKLWAVLDRWEQDSLAIPIKVVREELEADKPQVMQLSKDTTEVGEQAAAEQPADTPAEDTATEESFVAPMDGEEADEMRKAEDFIEKALGAKRVKE